MDKKIIGAGLGIGAAIAWEQIPGHEQFAMQLKTVASAAGDPETSPLAFLEHYHYGLLSFLIGKNNEKYRDYLYGFGAAMVGSELLQNTPFGIGKTEYEMKGNILMGIILGSLLLI
jgi:hypothetical protein